MNAKMNARIKRQLEVYCDLTPSMLAALDHPERGHPNSLSALEDGALLNGGKRTTAGQQLLERARQIMDETWQTPGPEFPITWLDNLRITVARCSLRKFGLRYDCQLQYSMSKTAPCVQDLYLSEQPS